MAPLIINPASFIIGWVNGWDESQRLYPCLEAPHGKTQGTCRERKDKAAAEVPPVPCSNTAGTWHPPRQKRHLGLVIILPSALPPPPPGIQQPIPNSHHKLPSRTAAPLTQLPHPASSPSFLAQPSLSSPTTRMSSSTPPPTADTPDEPQTDGSKLRTFLGILKNFHRFPSPLQGEMELALVSEVGAPTSPSSGAWRWRFIGVSDLAAVRFSLPSQLLEPTPNLEYWTYLDAPNAFIAIGTSDDALDRMLEVVRFWLTKDLKYAKGKPCKPYNSCLGEFFRCNWETEDNAPRIETSGLQKTNGTPKGSLSNLKVAAKGDKNASSVSLSVPQHGSSKDTKLVRVSYLTEQTSHHPPVSAFHVTCPEKGITARGFDQITAKFTGTSVKVLPGEHNMGIFISLDKRDGETYQLTHPAAHLGGLLRGALSVSVSEMAYITCPKTKIKVILHYIEEGWLGRTTNKIDGVVFKYDPENDTKTRVQDVPDEDVLARLSGPWKEKVIFTLGPRPVKSVPVEEQFTIIDIEPLNVAPKVIPPKEQQLPNESLTLWGGVTEAIHAKQYGKATQVKVELEEAQREKARQREAKNETWQPVFFQHVTGNDGKPDLTDKGQEVLERAQKGEWSLEGVL
ncbi:hypothetical protein MRS44_002833 [Fusarium solani]|uniref:uncharacterized protein n=1 Tax=Fusarium solani TaxID=169388 RepID=UPI0032C458A7|nr:hypothetical protein MRS44_002833 [Fusarium solani]